MRREVIIGALRRPNLAKQFDYAVRYFWSHRRAAVRGFSNTLQQACRRSLLEQITAGAGAQGIEDSFVVVVNGQHQHYQSRISRFQEAYAFDAAHARQADVREQHIWWVGADLVQCFFHRAKFAHALKAFAAIYQHPEALAQSSDVFNNRHTQTTTASHCIGGFFWTWIRHKLHPS